MTISTTASSKSYNGNGVTKAFSFPYRFFANDDLVVTLVASDGTQTVQTLSTDYTVAGADDPAGGTVTMVVAPAVGEQLIVSRVVAMTQEVDYTSGGAFPAETHERALDRLTMIAQQMNTLLPPYEENTWVPTLYDNSTGGTAATITSYYCHYTRIGRLITLGGTIRIDGVTGMTTSNIMYIRGLPYSPVSGTTSAGAVHLKRFSIPQISGYSSYFDRATIGSFGGANALSIALSGYAGTDDYLKVSSVLSGISTLNFSLTYPAYIP